MFHVLCINKMQIYLLEGPTYAFGFMSLILLYGTHRQFWPHTWPSSGWWEQEYKYNYNVLKSLHNSESYTLLKIHGCIVKYQWVPTYKILIFYTPRYFTTEQWMLTKNSSAFVGSFNMFYGLLKCIIMYHPIFQLYIIHNNGSSTVKSWNSEIIQNLTTGISKKKILTSVKVYNNCSTSYCLLWWTSSTINFLYTIPTQLFTRITGQPQLKYNNNVAPVTPYENQFHTLKS
jgi:hypothetical protein